jgi:CubicO group peptidase (beta-lactamase class C family)
VIRFAAAVALAGCAAPALVQPRADDAFGTSTPEAQGMDARPLLDLATWLRDHPEVPVFSVLVSRNGKVVFELYTGGIERDAAHYLMSTTKSVVGALIGIAIDKGLVPGPDAAIADALPADAFPSPEDRERFRRVTIRDLLGMSALDTPDPPRVHTPEAVARQHAFVAAPNRTRFALGQPIVPEPGTTFLYTDEGPAIATGILTYAAHEPVLRFAEDHLFGPLGFEHHEWMHDDPAGIANGGYGLRLRPIDMQKLGVLYLHGGAWNGRQLVPRAWVERSFSPWIRSSPRERAPNYGWYWWAESYGTGWDAHVASGWKGQRIIVLPAQQLVVTMTAYVEDGTEHALAARIVEDYIVPAVAHGASPGDPAALARVLDDLHRQPMRGPAHPEPRMIPSIEPKGH